VNRFSTDNAGKIKVMIEPNPDYDGYRQKINAMAAARCPSRAYSLISPRCASSLRGSTVPIGGHSGFPRHGILWLDRL
jgi:hypothetical protein